MKRGGPPCDYPEITYERLRGETGIEWGGERLYADGRFFAAPDVCETYGMDLATGAHVEPTEYRALNPDGRAILKAADHQAPTEESDDDDPMMLTTGRTLWHFHTRTKTARTPELQRAAPEPWAELSPEDLKRLALAEGDLVEISTPRGVVRAPARAGDLRDGLVFLPFHYGYAEASINWTVLCQAAQAARDDEPPEPQARASSLGDHFAPSPTR